MHDNVLGSANAQAELLEYLDYECPYCKVANGVVAELLQRFSGHMRYVARQFPLTRMHPHSLLAAQAAEAAGAQGAYWRMHEMLFSNQDSLELEDLLGYAESLELDAQRVALELADGTHLPKVRTDLESGTSSGVHGTPTFFLNGARFDGGGDVDSLSVAIENALSSGRRAHL